MVIPRIGNVKELDSRVIESHQIVAVFGICSNTLCVQHHALKRYISRHENEQSKLPVLKDSFLNELYYLLSISHVLKRSNEAKQMAKYGSQKAVYRYENGWIFVLTWDEQYKFWLLKTAYKKDDPQKHGYEVKFTRTAIRASSWSPSYA